VPGLPRFVVGAILFGLVIAGAAGARSDQSPPLTLDQPRVGGKWRLGWFEGGNVRVSGNVAVAAQLRAFVRSTRNGRVQATEVFSSQAGPYSVTLKLPKRPLPGRYRVSVVGAAPALPLVARIVTVRAPPEGIVGQAVISPRRGGPGARVLRGPRNEAWARFRFLFPPPRARTVTIQWKTPSADLVCQSPTGPLKGCRLPLAYSTTIHTYLRSSSGALGYGNWEARISVGRKLAKRAFIRLRR
jgi:hypothetical protein